MISNIVRIPKALLQDRVLVFLNIEDLVRFDTAVLNHFLRGQMIEQWQGAALCTNPVKIDADSAQWFLKRSIRVSALHVRLAASELALVKQLAGSVDTLVYFDDCNAETLKNFVPYCSNAKSLCFSRCFDGCMESAVLDLIAESCVKLQSIELPYNMQVAAGNFANLAFGCGKRITEINLSYGWNWVNFECMNAIAVNCPHLCKLVLEGCDIEDESIRVIAQHCHELLHLDVGTSDLLTDASLRALAACSAELRTFLIFSTPLITTDGIIALARGCTNLEEIGIPQSDKQIDLAVAALVQHCPALSVLRCSSNHFTDASLQALQQCKHLKVLEVCDAYRISSAALMHALMQLFHHSDLQSLKLKACQFQCPSVGDVIVAPQLFTTGCLSLKSVTFERCFFFTDELFQALISHCPNITDLNLNECRRLTEAAVLAAAANCRKLESLNISHVSVSDAAMCTVAQNCSNLRTLNASRCSLLTDATMSALAQHCPYLRHLDMSYCTLITDGGVEEILQKCRLLRELVLEECALLTIF